MLLLAEALWVEPRRRGFGRAVDLASVDLGLASAGPDQVAWPLALEALAQLGAVVASAPAATAGGAAGTGGGLDEPAAPAPARLGFLCSIPELAVHAPVRARAPLTLAVRVLRSRPGAFLFEGVAFSGAALAVEGRLLLSVARG
jgi:3-hydroxymyristoyl/3-hydroxydecanoyl-(acyl carrier protein) dehydratase